MLIPDWSKVTFSTVLSALGQAFFSLSLGMAIMVTYGSYVKKEENLAKNAAIICGMDTLVALIAGFIIVPAVFATLGAEGVGKGAGFAFSSLAGVFQQMPGGQFFGILFYMLLLFAALTSCISLVEGVVAFATERFGWKRTPTTIILCVVMFLLGTIYTCSQAAFDIKGIWFDFKNGLTTPIFGDFMEFLTDRLMIPCVRTGFLPVCRLGLEAPERHPRDRAGRQALPFEEGVQLPGEVPGSHQHHYHHRGQLCHRHYPQLNLLSSGTVSIQERRFSVMGHCLSCILPRCMVRCKTKAGGIFSPLPPANRRHTARRAFRLYRNRRLRRRNRLRRFALRAVPPHQTLQRSLPCPKTEIFSEHFPAKTA